MSPAEFEGFLAAAAPVAPPPLGALLIAESAGSSARTWGASYYAAPRAAAAPQPPFCDFCAPCNAWYLKTGGDPSKRVGWDHGSLDKCCSVDASDCVWFASEAACNAYDPASCRACGIGEDDVGCPSWASGGGGTKSVPLPAKYLATPPGELAQLSASLARNQNFSFQVRAASVASACVRRCERARAGAASAAE